MKKIQAINKRSVVIIYTLASETKRRLKYDVVTFQSSSDTISEIEKEAVEILLEVKGVVRDNFKLVRSELIGHNIEFLFINDKSEEGSVTETVDETSIFDEFNI